MSRVLRVLIVLILFELGIFLIVLPWSAIWENNYFLGHYPALIHIVLHPALRGVVSGLGFLDIVVAIGLLRRGPHQASQGSPSKLPPPSDQPII
jgi:hypothetical protein